MNKSQKEAFNIMAEKMDTNHKYKLELKAFYDEHGFLPDASEEFPSPDHHRQSYDAFRLDGFKCWRAMPAVRKRIIKAAKKAAKAKGLEALTEEAQRGA